MTESILLTGGTGFLGTELAARLIRIPGVKIYACIRSENQAEAYCRAQYAWFHEKELYWAIGGAVIPVSGDFTKSGLGFDAETRQILRETVTLVLHVGAEIGFQKSAETLFKANATGTERMLSFAADIKNLRRFVYVSTAYVAGRKSGLVTEDESPGAAFSSQYERSKAEAETMVRASGLPFSVCRPGMIVGDSKSGWIRNFNTIYYVLKLMLLGKMRVFPMKPETPLNLVPGDYAADCVIKISFSEEAEGKTFHITCPKEAAPRAGELAERVRDWAERNLSVSLPKAVFVPMPVLKRAGLLHNSRKDGKKKNIVNNLLTLLPYFFGEQEFDRTNTERICGSDFPQWREYVERLLQFACRKNFMRQTPQSVFEQARVRRESRRYPIYYYDVSADGIRKVTGQEANRRIDEIRNALWAWGVRKGDRIALTGVNSVEYMTLEQALGLMGAVSVPIYYTTPPAETALLLRKSGATWFFIGDSRMMEQLDALNADAQIVSFSAGEIVKHPSAMPWALFLERATESAPRQYPAPEDLATIRYTSGTTGEPKGVTFRYGQLAWMGEVLANLLPWKDRNHALRYLSFLPLSHVVEGILAAYAPYYLLARVDYYYLNDFNSLSVALPKVRPNVFFSVPRFYEKVWNQTMSKRIGKAWLAAKEGAYKRTLGAILRKGVLRKAGIDRCKQLIVGSAPVSETLLRNFRTLGIEIHNAYGQTEAPLISMNRMGDNVIPTVGTPLPETAVRVVPDGELIVEGPQVTPGYYRLEAENIRNGVLQTGDLGSVQDNGHIILYGRKKDFIVTAYGKNVSIPKLEEKLKDIPGVAEAMLIGEGRPYCAALLWLDRPVPDLGGCIERINAELSRPERIRGYRVASSPLSVQAGELTPNLKLKRANIEAHFAREIEEMYR